MLCLLLLTALAGPAPSPAAPLRQTEGVRCLAWASGGKWLVANGGKKAVTVVPSSARRPGPIALAAEERERLWGELRGEDAVAAVARRCCGWCGGSTGGGRRG